MRNNFRITYFLALLVISLFTIFALAACQENSSQEPSKVKDAKVEVNASQDEAETKEGKTELLESKPKVADIPKNNHPNRLITTFHGDTRSQMGFNWYTTDKFKDAKVWISESEDMSNAISFSAEATEVTNQYAERTEEGYYIYADVEKDDEGNLVEDENGNPIINGYYTDEGKAGPEWMSGADVGYLELIDVKEYSYKAVASDLKPNTSYYYQVGSKSGEKSEVGKFSTSGEAGDAFTFVHYTDTQNAYWNENVRNEAAFGADTIKHAIEVAGNPDFVVHTGDLVEIAEVEDEWVDLFSQSEAHWLKQPLAVAPGNHDEYGIRYYPLVTEKFNEHINVPITNGNSSGGSYYSYDYNGVHFVIANTNDNKKSKDNPEEKALGKEQLAWIKEDVKQARKNGAKWVILAYHKPLFSKSYHSLLDEDVQKVREEFMQLIDELDIDLVLQGHDHVVSRTKALNFVPSKESFSNAVIDEAEIVIGDDHVEYYKNPEGTVFVLPNTGGTKAYDDLYSKSLAHIKQVRPKLDWMTQEDVDYYNGLFAFGGQPQKDGAFTNSHSNNRDSSVQNFAVYNVEEDKLTVEIYQVFGDLSKGEDRVVEKVHEFGIDKE